MRVANLFSLVVVVIKFVGRNGTENNTTNRREIQKSRLAANLYHRLKSYCLKFVTMSITTMKEFIRQ